MIEELVDHPVQEAGVQLLADVYRQWEPEDDDPRFCHVQSQLKIEKIRKVQAFVLLLLLRGLSVLLLARTGWGKSLIFQGLRYAALKDLDRPQKSRYITVIFVPLSGLGQEQADEINEKAGSNIAIFYDKTKVDNRHLLDIRNGLYHWVFISPEKALHPKTVKMLWENVDFRENILLFAVDEGHLVVEWGGGGFRKAYDELGRIRNYFGDTVPWFVTSATMPAGTQKEVMQSIGIVSYKSVITELDRPNLYYNIMISRFGARFNGKGGTALDFIFDEARRSKTTVLEDITKSIVYFDEVGQLKLYVKHFRDLLPPHLKTPSSTTSTNQNHRVSPIQPYYADRSDIDKRFIREVFAKGTCRVICATEAFGLGMNVKDVLRVYQVNPPRNMAQQMQRFGRGARDKQLNAICTIVLSRSWKKLSCDSSYKPSNRVQRKVQGGPKKELYLWLTAPCLRQGFLKFLDVPGQYNPGIIELGQCCSRCTERAIAAKTVVERPIIGYQGLARPELEDQRIAKEKADRDRIANQETHPICEARVLKYLLEWRERVWKETKPGHGIWFPGMIAPDSVLEMIAKNIKGIMFLDLPVQWAGKEFCETHFNNPGWREVATNGWNDSLDEVEKAIDEKKAKKEEVKRQKAETKKLKKSNKKPKPSKLSQVENMNESESEKSQSQSESGVESEASDSGSDSSADNMSSEKEVVRMPDVEFKRGRGRPKGSKNKPKKDSVGGKVLLKQLANKSQGQSRTS